VADKLTQHITDALTKAAAHPTGLPLYATKTEAGLFPNTAAAKPAAQKCLTDQLLQTIGSETKGKQTRELYALTEAGWEFLLAAVNPRQVLEDFVRVLEARQGEVGELLDNARRMADSLQGLKDAVVRVLPSVSAGRVNAPVAQPAEPVVAVPSTGLGSRLTEHLNPEPEAVVVEVKPDLGATLLAQLADWSGTAGEDCPLPELYRSLTGLLSPPSIGEFHDCLRRLHADGAIYLHPWTGPLYAIPEPAYALLVGHNIAYYASIR
jgi:hypothetical protein